MSPNPFILSPSLLSCDFGRLKDELTALEEAGLEWVHWDVMDGLFVPNITLGPPIIKQCRDHSKLIFDVHLMIVDPDRYVGAFVDAGADVLVVHAEAERHLERCISEIVKHGAKPGVALNPHTPLDILEYLLPELEMVLIMSVNPGFGGQKFIPFTKEKTTRLRRMVEERGLKTRIQMDGGVTPENTGELVAAGADTLVSGSAFFAKQPYNERYQEFLRAAQESSQNA